MKCYLKIAAGIATGIAVLLMVLGIIARLNGGTLLKHWWGSFYYASPIFFYLAIVCLLFAIAGCDKKEV